MARRPAGSREIRGSGRFTTRRDEPRFQVRSGTLTRRLTCSFDGSKLLHATETYYLRLLSRDREDPGFTADARSSGRYYLECEGRVATSRATFVAGQELSFATNTFTLPCGHMIYSSASDSAERVSGRYGYKVQEATLKVRRGPTAQRPTFDVDVDAIVTNPIETLHIDGRLTGELATVVSMVQCPRRRPGTKPVTPEGCPG